MAVNSFDPSASSAKLDINLVRELIETCADTAETPSLDLAAQARFAPIVIHGDWDEIVDEINSAEIEILIRVLTVGEGKFTNWQAGPKSAVIPLVKALKVRGEYDKTMTRWIKSHTDNKFLPHGNVMDRL